MGANYFGYAADITCTFPVNGVFTEDQKLIYEAVLASNLAVFKAGKPGVSWAEMHLLANKVLLEELKKGGLLQGSVDERMEADLAAIFQPHGLGHLMGLDVHDVGGYLEGYPQRPNRPGVKSLRTARILEENMILTIEPGCYFINPVRDHYTGKNVFKEKSHNGRFYLEFLLQILLLTIQFAARVCHRVVTKLN